MRKHPVISGRLNRRQFLKGSAAGVAVAAFPRQSLAARSTPQSKLLEFDYADVRLTGGPLKAQYDRILASYLALDNDRLLKVYRQRAGLPAPGADMGGWYDADGFVPGHALGQYISGLSRYARATGSADARTKARELVRGFAQTLGPKDYPYASAKASTTWPCYILDKYEIGLLDACELAGMEGARDLLSRVIRGALPYLPDRTYDRGPDSPKQAPYDETYILSENLFRSAELTQQHQFVDLATKYLLDEYFDPLAAGKNILPGKHAYSHVLALSSAARAYLVLKDGKYLRAMENAWQMLSSTQQYASGGWGPKETFVEPNQGKLYDSLFSTGDHFETPCGAYAQMKLARYLISFTGEARYGDGLERVLYNTILGARDPDGDGNFFYYSNYHPLARKGYYQSKWPCCSGTLVQGVADYVLNVYFRNDDGIWVNLYTPSEVRWKNAEVPVTLTQSTNYPNDGRVEIRVDVPTPTDFTVALRIPQWLRQKPSIAINGRAETLAIEPGTFARLTRKWRQNDVIALNLPLDFRTEAIDNQHPETVAVMRGPIMFVAAAPPDDIATTPLSLPEGLRSLDYGAGIYEYKLPAQTLRFRPFFAIHDERYNTYFRRRA